LEILFASHGNVFSDYDPENELQAVSATEGRTICCFHFRVLTAKGHGM